MAIKLSTTVRSAIATAIKDAIDIDGANPGKILIYSGTRPATAGGALSGNTLLGTLTLNKPCGTVSNGVLTLDIDPAVTDSSADATGTATWARVTDGISPTATFVADMSVGTSAADIIMNLVTIVENGPITITSATFTAGNA